MEECELETRNSNLRFRHHQSLARKLPIEHFRAFLSAQRLLDVGFPSLGAQKGDAAAAARAANLRGLRAVSQAFSTSFSICGVVTPGASRFRLG